MGSWVAGMTVRTGGNKEKYICGKHGGDGEKQENLFIVAVFAERVCSDAVKVIQAWQQPSPLRFSTEETVAGKKLRSLEANLQTLRACQTEEAAAPNKIFFFFLQSHAARRGISQSDTNHMLHGGAGDHKLHLLSQHGRCRLLLDQVVSPVDLQLGLQVGRRMQVLAVFSRAAALRARDKSL